LLCPTGPGDNAWATAAGPTGPGDSATEPTGLGDRGWATGLGDRATEQESAAGSAMAIAAGSPHIYAVVTSQSRRRLPGLEVWSLAPLPSVSLHPRATPSTPEPLPPPRGW
jgi:hypothetical protein